MALSKTKCLILASNTEAIYLDDQSGIRKQTVFRLDQNKVVVAMVMQEMYIIIVYESSVAIYNSVNGDFLEEKGKLDKQFKYKSACVNYAGNDVYLYVHHNSGGKNVVLSEVF